MSGSDTSKPAKRRPAEPRRVEPCVIEQFKAFWEAVSKEDRRTIYDIMKRKIEGGNR